MNDPHMLIDADGRPCWRTTDTSGARFISDENLINLVAIAQKGSGWGLVAELLKRFDALLSDQTLKALKKGPLS